MLFEVFAVICCDLARRASILLYQNGGFCW